MTTVKVLSNAGLDVSSLVYGVLMSAKPESASLTAVSAVDPATLEAVVFSGAFRYDSQGHLSGGKVTGLDFYSSVGGDHLLSGTNTSIDASTLYQALAASQTSGSTTPLQTLLVNIPYTLTGGAGLDTLTGGSFGDSLSGGNGNDVLFGMAGNDLLRGGAGSDMFFGGAGSDKFIFERLSDTSVGRNRDTIADFNQTGKDLIGLSRIDANSKVAGDQAFSFIAGSAFTHHAGELHFQHGILSGDVNGDGKADFEIAVSHVAALSSSDIVLWPFGEQLSEQSPIS
jgi:Ca2+-binding RTX toxin-like protein